MLRDFFARRPRLSAVVATVIAAAGAFALSVAKLSDYPEVAPTIVQVSATYSGASPSVIADTVATPIEDQINSVENVYFFDSRCNDSGSYELFVTFLPGTNPDMNLVNVQNAVKRAEPKLPSEVLQVGLTIEKCSSDYAVQFVFTTDGTEMDHIALGNFVNHEIKDALQRVRGISSVSCSNNEYAMRVWLDTLKMDALGLSVSDVRGAIAGQNIQPAAGFVGNAMSSPYLSYKVNAPGRLVTAAEFESIVVRTDAKTGARVLLGDIARCELGSKSYTQEPRVDGRLCYLASAYADSEANTREVARACLKTVDEWMRRAPKGVGYKVLHDQADYMEELLGNFAWAFGIVVLLSLVLFAAFTRLADGLRPAAVVTVSLLSGATVLWATGWTLDVITVFAFLGGFALAFLTAAGGSSAALTLLVAAVFVPLAFYGGMVGAMFVRFSVVAGVISAVASVLSVMFSAHRVAGESAKARSWGRALLLCAVAAALGVTAAWLPKGFVPEEDKGFIKIEVELSEGSSLARTRAVVAQVDELLADVPGVELVYTAAGNSAASKVGENHAAISILLKPWKERRGLSVNDVCAEIERRLRTIDTAKFYVMLLTPLRGTGGIGGCKVSLCAIGSVDPAEQAADAEAYAERFRAMPDVQAVVTTFSADTPQLYLSVDRDKAQALGVTVSSVFSTLQSKLASFYVNDFNIDGCSRQVIVQNEYEGRDALEDALAMRFPGPNGAMVPLSAVGAFKYTLGPRVIPRIEKRVAAGVVIRPKPGLSTLELVDRIEKCPPDLRKYVAAYSTMTRAEVESRGKFGRMAVAGLLLSCLVLVALRESWLEPLKLLAEGLPAVGGGVFGIFAFGQEFTILAQLALVFLFAFAVGFALRPVRAVALALVLALAAALAAAGLLLDVGSGTFAAFAVPLAAGMAVLFVFACRTRRAVRS